MKRKKILFADDNADLVICLCQIVEEEGHQVKVIFNGKDAYDELLNHNFDIAFIDIDMPEMNGIEVLRMASLSDLKTPIILMTGYRIEQLFSRLLPMSAINLYDTSIEYLEDSLNKESQYGQINISIIQNEDAEMITAGLFDNADDKKRIKRVNTLQCKNSIDIGYGINVLMIDTKQPLSYILGIIQDNIDQFSTLDEIIIRMNIIDKDIEGNSLKSLATTGCLFKPFDPEDIIKIISDI